MFFCVKYSTFPSHFMSGHMWPVAVFGVTLKFH